MTTSLFKYLWCLNRTQFLLHKIVWSNDAFLRHFWRQNALHFCLAQFLRPNFVENDDGFTNREPKNRPFLTAVRGHRKDEVLPFEATCTTSESTETDPASREGWIPVRGQPVRQNDRRIILTLVVPVSQGKSICEMSTCSIKGHGYHKGQIDHLWSQNDHLSLRRRWIKSLIPKASAPLIMR